MKFYEPNDYARAGRAVLAMSPFGDRYGMRFHRVWKDMHHNDRMAFRQLMGKGDDWMPPGYPGFWD